MIPLILLKIKFWEKMSFNAYIMIKVMINGKMMGVKLFYIILILK